MRELVSGVETVPALSDAMERRIRLLNASVDFMEKLHARLVKSDENLLKPEVVVEWYKMLSHEFTEVLEVCRRCSSDDLVGRLDNLRLYQLIQNLSPAERDRLCETLMPKAVGATVSKPAYTPVEPSTPPEPIIPVASP